MVTTQVPDPDDAEEDWLPIIAAGTGFMVVVMILVFGLIETFILMVLLWMMAMMILGPMWVVRALINE